MLKIGLNAKINLDQGTRKLIKIHTALHQRANEDRLYHPKKNVQSWYIAKSARV